MPYPIAALSKRDIRPDVAAHLGDNWPLATTSAGNAGGTTAVCSSLIGVPVAAMQNKYLLVEEGTNDGEYRVASAFAPATGTITVRRAYTGQVANSIDCHLHEFSPHLYTMGINEAIREGYPALRRDILHHTFARQPGTQRTVPLPRDMDRAVQVFDCGRLSEKLRDYFDRAASTTDPGGKWSASVGTWGITSEGLYSVSDADANLVLAATNPQLKNGVIEFRVRGDITSGASRVLALVFRYEDSSNYLVVRLLNNQVDLRRVFGGTEASLLSSAPTVSVAENVDAVVRVMFDGSWVDVWVNDRQYIHHELTGEDLAYLGYDESGTGTFGNIGFRLDKSGSPSLAATATRVSHVFAHELSGRVERGDWRRSGQSIELQTNGRGASLVEGRMIWIEGITLLTEVNPDTVFEALASDTTDLVELQKTVTPGTDRTSPEYQFLTLYAAHVVAREAARLGMVNNPEQQRQYREMAAELGAQAAAQRRRIVLPPARVWR